MQLETGENGIVLRPVTAWLTAAHASGYDQVIFGFNGYGHDR